MKPDRRNSIFLILVVCLAVWFLSAPRAWSQSEHTAKLIEGAKKEGKLAWYTSVAFSDSKRLVDAFEKNYPFVKTEVVRSSGDRLLNRILTETRAGKWNFDAVLTARMDILVQQKLISPYVSPEARAYIENFKDSTGYWTGVYSNYYVIGYNTQQVTPADSPQKWRDLLEPRWNGKISIDQEEYQWYATLVATWGRAKAQNYMKRLAMQNIQWRKGHTLIAQSMAAGEFPLAIVFAHRIEDMKTKGAPVEWVDTLDPIVASIGRIGLSSRANNVNTAKLFIDFVLSREGQEMIRSFNLDDALFACV